MHGVLFPLMRFGERQQVTVRHIQGLVLVIGERTRVAPLSDGDLLDPADGVEPPGLEIGSHGLLDPTHRAAAVFLLPDMNVLGIAQTRWIDVVDPHRKERLPVRGDQPPMIFSLTESKETLRLNLSGLDGRSNRDA